MNQTLSRTILTSGSVVIVLIALILFGGKVIHEFAWILLIGVLAGTYSTVTIVPAVAVAWNNMTGRSTTSPAPPAPRAPKSRPAARAPRAPPLASAAAVQSHRNFRLHPGFNGPGWRTSSYDSRPAKADPSRLPSCKDEHFDRVYAYVLRSVGVRSDVQDITADGFQSGLENLNRFEWRGAPFAAWLYRIAANAIADHFHRKSRPLPDGIRRNRAMTTSNGARCSSAPSTAFPPISAASSSCASA